jgi:hypothetical protein
MITMKNQGPNLKGQVALVAGAGRQPERCYRHPPREGGDQPEWRFGDMTGRAA